MKKFFLLSKIPFLMDIAVFLITYGILFIGELGDKTQLIVFNLALEYKKFFNCLLYTSPSPRDRS